MSNLRQLYPQRLTGRQVRHLNTLTAMMSGIVQSQACHLEKIARKVPEATQVESRIKRFTRFNQNEHIDADTYYMPFLRPLIASLSNAGSITLAMDGSETGQGCMTLMVSIIYHKRALPIAWQTVVGNKGHLPEAVHITLLNRVQALFPEQCHIVFLGDGEFDGINLQAAIKEAGWEYVCRTARNCIIKDGDDEFSLSEIGLVEGDCIDMPDVQVTRQHYGPVLAIAWWCSGYTDPIYLVTNMDCVEEACRWYKRRFTIETFFSDQKSRGFNLQKSHLSDPERISRFLIATCLAYIWMIYLGVKVRKKPAEMRMFHRADRCDLSLFQLGLRYLEFLLNQERELPFGFTLPA
jgi:hypothetical protein